METIYDPDDAAWLVLDEDGHQISPLFATELEARQWAAHQERMEEW